MGAIVWPLLIYWLVLFVACYVVVEVAQDQLYDEVTPRSGLKVAAGSLILAGLLTWLRPSFDTMFTNNFAWTVLQAIVWSAVFTLIFQFHPQHGAVLGIITMLLVPGVATMGVDSVLKPTPTLPPARSSSHSQPVRRPLGPVAPPAKAETPAAK